MNSANAPFLISARRIFQGFGKRWIKTLMLDGEIGQRLVLRVKTEQDDLDISLQCMEILEYPTTSKSIRSRGSSFAGSPRDQRVM